MRHALSAWMLSMLLGTPALAGVDVGPYASISSTKTIKPVKKDQSKESEVIKQRQEAGLRASIGFFSLLRAQASVGQSVLTTTEKTQYAKDEYGEIDYEKDLNMSTEDPEAEVKTTETQKNARATLIIDPSFSIFVLRAKAGMTARQRIVEVEQAGVVSTTTTGPKFMAHSGFGAGVRLGAGAYFIMEYGFEHYAFPEVEPFERNATISFGLSL